ncbi:MAG: Platinum sensitivity protein [Alyxoria varia]|nr:MAG: Platinum sensitivity protein [Alyxoria varia]
MATQLSAHERKRVKVYELRDNDWFDRGTGFCSVQAIHDDARISVESEDEPERILLNIQIKRDDSYAKQQETLIVWTDPSGIDMALSFQESEGCASVCESIDHVQRTLPVDPAENMPATPDLPPPDLPNLPDIEECIRRASGTQIGRDSMSKIILQENYITALVPLVAKAEEQHDLSSLHHLCNIMKSLILFNDNAIIEHTVKDHIILGVVGALEYDPDFPRHKANHRQYLSDESKFKEVVPIEEPEIKDKIHFTYRLQYLKDVVLARILDDPTFGVLNSMIFFNQVDIVQHIQSNMAYLKAVFALISDPKTEVSKKKDAVALIQQSCAIAKNLQLPTRASLYQNFISCGLFPTVTFALQHHDPAIRVAGTDILVSLIDHDAPLIRSQIIRAVSEGTKPMTDTLIDLLLVETDLGVKSQISDAIKILLDSQAAGPEPPQRPQMPAENGYLAKMRNTPAVTMAAMDSFLSNFYDHSAKILFRPLNDLGHRKTDNLSLHDVLTYSHLVEILSFFIRQHHYRSKMFIIQENLHARVGQLMVCSEKHLKLTAIKFFKTCITLQDEFHNRKIITENLFEPILDIITSTMPRDNLLNSACLELFEYIRRENIKPLIVYLVETFRSTLDSISYVETFRTLIARYEMIVNPPPPDAQGESVDSSFLTSDTEAHVARVGTINGGGGRWQGLKEVDEDEDAYFNTSDTEEDDEDELAKDSSGMVNGLTRLGSHNKPLVDYDDDDEEEDDLNVKEFPILKSTREFDNDDIDTTSPSSSPPNETTTTHETSPPSPPSPPASAIPRPPSSLAEKRRREDDDDDELGKLSSGVKRRNSSTGSINLRSISPRLGGQPQLGPRDPQQQKQQQQQQQQREPEQDVDGDWEFVDPPLTPPEGELKLPRSIKNSNAGVAPVTKRISPRLNAAAHAANGGAMDMDTSAVGVSGNGGGNRVDKPKKISISLGGGGAATRKDAGSGDSSSDGGGRKEDGPDGTASSPSEEERTPEDVSEPNHHAESLDEDEWRRSSSAVNATASANQ